MNRNGRSKLMPDWPMYRQALPVLYAHWAPKGIHNLGRWKHFYVEAIQDDEIALALAAEVLMEQTEFPWPLRESVICAHHPTKGRIILFRYPDEIRQRYYVKEAPGEAPSADEFVMYGVNERGAVTFSQPMDIRCRRKADLLHSYATDAPPKTVDERLRYEMPLITQWQRLACPMGDTAWLATELEKGPNGLMRGWDSYTEAANIFGAMAAIGTSCRYHVHAVDPRGWGPPSVKKVTRGSGIDVFIGSNRLYAHAAAEGNGDRIFQPHERRAHERYLWFKRGINRLALPQDRLERAILAKIKKVPKVWVKECYVGPRRFRDGPLDCRVVEDDNGPQGTKTHAD